MTGDYDYICTYDQISLDWEMGNITPTARERVSTRFEGKIVAPESNTYIFYLTHDDGARLYINDAIKIDYWTAGRHGNTSINLLKIHDACLLH